MKINQKAIESGWIYSEEKHPVINQNFASKNTDKGLIVMFEDRTLYNEEEIKILDKIGGLTENIHLVKNVFRGELVGGEKIVPTMDN